MGLRQALHSHICIMDVVMVDHLFSRGTQGHDFATWLVAQRLATQEAKAPTTMLWKVNKNTYCPEILKLQN